MEWQRLDPNILGWIIIGALTLINTYYSRKTEKNTNSMKDALVKATSDASYRAGHRDATAEAADTAATLAKGVLQGTQEKSK